MSADQRLALIRRKVERAETHFKNLETVRDRFIESKPYTIGSEPDPKPGYESFDRYFMTRIDEIDPDIALIAGDVIHNLRSALDHLACQLVEVGGGTVTTDIMYPIARGDTLNERSFRGKVEGMRDAAKDKIRGTEPYQNGQGHYLWVLHKLDIAEKHKALLTTLIHVSTVKIRSREGSWDFIFPRFSVPDYGEALEVGKPFFTCERSGYEDTDVAFDVAISEPDVIEPKPVVWAMKYFIGKVDSLILSFRDELN